MTINKIWKKRVQEKYEEMKKWVTAWSSHEELCNEESMVTNEKRIVIHKINEYDKEYRDWRNDKHELMYTQEEERRNIGRACRISGKKNSEFCRLVHIRW